MIEKIYKICENGGALATREKAKRLAEYVRLLLAENENVNLTAAKTEDAMLAHIADSLAAARYFGGADAGFGSVCDIGSGGGFPGVPLAIALPHVHFTLTDSRGKKIEFLRRVAAALGLENVECVHCRIDERGNGLFGKFDAACARAVAPLSTLLEYAAPLVKVGGMLALFKGPRESRENAVCAERLLNLAFCEKLEYAPPLALLIYKKVAPTPDKFPRAGNLARKKPL